MLISRYLGAMFVKKIIWTSAICYVIAFLVEFTQSIPKYKSKYLYTGRYLSDALDAAVFLHTAFFFIILIACLWFFIKIITSFELQICVLYRHSLARISWGVTKVTLATSLIYISLFDGFILEYASRYNNQISQTASIKKKIWIKDLHYNGVLANGRIIAMNGVKKSSVGVSVKHTDIYTITDSKIVKYQMYNDIIIYKTQGLPFFVTKGARNTMQAHTLSLNEFNSMMAEFQNDKASRSIHRVIYSMIRNESPPTHNLPLLVNVLQSIVLLPMAPLIVLTEIKTFSNRNNALKKSTLKVFMHAILVYALLEILKVSGYDNVQNHIIALIATIALFLMFLARFIRANL